MKKIIIVTFLFNVFFATNIFAADFGKITITERQPFGAEFFASGASTQHGYAEYRFLVQNHDNIPHKVKISIEPRSHYRSGTIIFSMDTAEIAAGSRTTLRLLQPPILIDSSLSATVNIDGWERDLTLNADNHMNNSRFGYTSSVHSTVCFSQQVPTTIREFFARRSTLPPDDEVKATPPPPTMSHSSPANMLTSMYSNVPVDDWSDSWISYTRFDSVAITSVEWNDLITRKPAVLSAIKRYVEAGGILIMVGKNWEIPAEWESIFKTKPKDKGIDATIVCGKVFVIGSNSAEVAADAPHFDNIIKQIDIASGIEKQRIEFAQNLYRNNQIISRMHEILPVVTEYGVNVRLILVLIIVFAILIGPVNVFVL
ncbi:MAG: hypothetical protein LBH59_04045, partial [Planctomycetaceae bacterium]|nr:hypothetical protein [Planctomycetaceae bacterium]